MKKFILKYWFVLPILLALFMLILLVLLLQYTVNQSSTVFTNIVSVILLLIFIALPVSWVILAKNKKWGKVAISFGASLVIFCVFGIPIFLSSLFAPDNETSERIIRFVQTTSFSKLVDEQSFTIYEGDWGDYYLARIEVWFRDAETKEEKKLAEKVYRVEGWMR